MGQQVNAFNGFNSESISIANDSLTKKLAIHYMDGYIRTF